MAEAFRYQYYSNTRGKWIDCSLSGQDESGVHIAAKDEKGQHVTKRISLRDKANNFRKVKRDGGCVQDDSGVHIAAKDENGQYVTKTIPLRDKARDVRKVQRPGSSAQDKTVGSYQTPEGYQYQYYSENKDLWIDCTVLAQDDSVIVVDVRGVTKTLPLAAKATRIRKYLKMHGFQLADRKSASI